MANHIYGYGLPYNKYDLLFYSIVLMLLLESIK